MSNRNSSAGTKADSSTQPMLQRPAKLLPSPVLVAVISQSYRDFDYWLQRNGEFGKEYYPIVQMMDIFGRRFNEFNETDMAKGNPEYYSLKQQVQCRVR